MDYETESDNTLEDDWQYTTTIAPSVESTNARTPLWHGLSDEVSSVPVPIVRACIKGTTINNNDRYNDSGCDDDGGYEDVGYKDGTLTDDNHNICHSYLVKH